MKRTTLVIALTALLTGVTLMPAASASEQRDCRDVSAESRAGTIRGTLCDPGNAETLQVLVHGASYARYYWDFPYQPERYSYVRDATERGYATLAVDRLGAGESDTPLFLKANTRNQAAAVHEIIQKFSDEYENVVYVGHSLGTITGWYQLATYHDADLFIATGATHYLNPSGVVRILSTIRPAGQLGYVTTAPGQRDVFYDRDLADPAVIRKDEQLKSEFSSTELIFHGIPEYVLVSSRRIEVPTLVVVGSEDGLLCGTDNRVCENAETLERAERPKYGGPIDAYVEQGAGHDLALHTTAPRTNDAILDWIDEQLRQ